jgi:hypothetical protein
MQKKNWLVIILGVFVCGMFLFGWVYTSLSADDFYVIPAGNRNVKTDTTNTAIGVNALKSNTSGTLNTASGAGALSANTTGSYNTASGAHALLSNTIGRWNTADGAYALAHNTTADKNTAVGQGALYTQSFDNGNTAYDTENTAVGFHALFANQPTSAPGTNFKYYGIQNTALGSLALPANTTGSDNTAAGYGALYSNTTGTNNTAFGVGALYNDTSTGDNTAIGEYALYNCSGNYNTAIGDYAGYADPNFSGNYDICIGWVSPKSLTESNTIRIGDTMSQTFIAGIDGANIGTGTTVYINSSGQLGTVTSSRRYKEDIRDMGAASAGLMQLRPVTFYYKPKYAHGDHTLQYGLIAEEVAKVYPNLVQYDKTGKPQTVYYHLINAMLLNEVQKQHRQLQAETKALKTLHDTVSKQNKKLAALQQQQRLSAAQNRKLLARLAQLESQVKQVATTSKPAGYRPVVEAAAASAIP